MFIVVLLLPLISALILNIFGTFIGTIGSLFISCINLIVSGVISFSLFWFWSQNIGFCVDLWPWLNLNSVLVFFSLRYDSLTAVMFIVVTGISSIVHLYSAVYMYSDPFLLRFMSYLSLFTFFMLLLVSSGNILVLFIGWEGVGLCSYLLIGFWHIRAQAGKAATKAFIINKVGDLFLLTGISLMLMLFHSVDFSVISVLTPFCPSDLVEIISIFLFLGAVGKSAQIGLHTWLPDAIEGPTPVSALIHAATIVTAGVFLIIRCSSILEYAPRVLYLIAVWGGATALFSGTIGAVQNDIKKIIAYSTCSQLGYMVLVCGLSSYHVGFFHLFNHAFFKALLFLSAGSIIHILNNEQDIRKIGGLGRLTPFIYINVLIGSLALAGFPFLAGFYSKDVVIEVANTKHWIAGQFLYWLSTIAAILTIYYSIRLIYMVFLKTYGGFKVVLTRHSKVTYLEILLLGTLGMLSFLSGYYFKDLFVGFGANYFNNCVTLMPSTWCLINLEFIPAQIKLIPSLASVIALIVVVVFASQTFHASNKVILSSRVSIESCKWFYNEVVNGYITLSSLRWGRHFFEQYEKNVLEYHGPIFVVSTLNRVV